MPEANADLLSTAEEAMAALVVAANIAGVTAANVFTGSSTVDKTAPCVICGAQDAPEEDPPYTGNYWVDSEIEIKGPAAADTQDGQEDPPVDPKIAIDAMSKAVFDLFKSQTLGADMNALGVPNFTVQGWTLGGMRFVDSGDELVNVFSLRLYCCNSTLPA